MLHIRDEDLPSGDCRLVVVVVVDVLFVLHIALCKYFALVGGSLPPVL